MLQYKALVIGLARSGLASVKLLKQQGFHVVLTTNERLEPKTKEELVDVEIIDGQHPLSLLDDKYDFIVKNPGIPYTNPFVQEAVRRHFKIISEVELAYMFSNNIYLAITGTNGKTTTATLAYQILRKYYTNIFLAGNVGVPLSDIVRDHCKDNIVVVELSNFQLMGTIDFKPHVATILNLSPDHLDYMNSVEEYYRSKTLIYKNQTQDDYFLYNLDDPLIDEFINDIPSQIVTFSVKETADIIIEDNWIVFRNQKVIDLANVQLLGVHNIYNMMVAIGYAMLMKVPVEIIRDVVYQFRGVPYRLEYIGEYNNLKFYNDSKSTTPDSTITAIKAVEQNPYYLILGGFDKGLDYEELIVYLENSENLQKVFTYGEIKNVLANVLKEDTIVFNDLSEIMNYIKKSVHEGVVLFSPATSSFDQYADFEKRGQHFNDLVKEFF